MPRLLPYVLLFVFIGTVTSCQDKAANQVIGGKAENPVLALAREGSQKVHFTYGDKPLLSVGGGAGDGMFWLGEDAFDYKKWADWEAKFGMNHSRDYLPLSWMTVVHATRQNGGDTSKALFPFKKVDNQKMQFDLTQFDEAYWKRFRQQCEYLNRKGIIIHLLMWNGWQTNPRYPDALSWEGHFFNPKNNVNAFTDNLVTWQRLYYPVVEGNNELLEVQKRWFEKIIETTYDLGNVYYDLIHEFGDLVDHLDLEKGKTWVEYMATAVHRKWIELGAQRQLILGMDAGKDNTSPIEGEFPTWVFSQPYFNILVWGKNHTHENIIGLREKYNKPYIGQEIWDDNRRKYSIRRPQDSTHIRKYFWKMVMLKCQQLDIYHKDIGKNGDKLPGYPLNYDPNGVNAFEKHMPILRKFWNTLTDYPDLWPVEIKNNRDGIRIVSASANELVVYLSSATGNENIKYEAQRIKLSGLPVKNGKYKMTFWKPDAVNEGTDVSETQISDGKTNIDIPEFTDDFVIHVFN